MIFTPYSDESQVLRSIQSIQNGNYALIRLTRTMIDKGIMDANVILRDLLSPIGIDYDTMLLGGENGIVRSAICIKEDGTEPYDLSFYRANTRGDRRFSIHHLKKKVAEGVFYEGDLFYISLYKDAMGELQLFFVDLTHNIPCMENLISTIGRDPISMCLEQIKPRLMTILHGGYFDNSNGVGAMASRDVGDTLEHLLGIEMNNRRDADINGLIEVKSKGSTSTLDTLFTLRPLFDGTRVATMEPNDRNRVSAFARLYGYDSESHPGYNSLYITIGAAGAPQNNQGFYLDVNEDDRTVEIRWINPKTKKKELAGYWKFDDLRKQLEEKHPATLWVQADSQEVGDLVQFKYTAIEFSRAPQFATFLSLIKQGSITYDWRGYTTKEGPYKGKNHGNAWRIRPQAKSELFGEMVDLSI